MCEEQGVICDLPKRILMVGREPNVVGAALDGFAEHGEASVILALQYGLERISCGGHGDQS